MASKVLLLALLQGVAEFLPISSSGHLAIAGRWLGLDSPGAGLALLLHLGTLLSVVAFYRRRLARLAAGLVLGVRASWRQAGAIVLGCTPVAAAYALFGDNVKRCLDKGHPFMGAMLIVTGAVLLSTRLARKGRNGEMSPARALLVGAAQAFALLPGISRSGMTISAARHLGVERREAADFSFIMSIPLLAGAALMPLAKGQGLDLGGVSPALAVAAAALSAVTGYFSLRLLIGILSGPRFWIFGLYCVAAGALALILA